MSKQKKASPRQIDEKMASASKRLKSKFVLVPSMEIKAWKAFIIIMFAAGFSAALIWSAYNGWYVDSSAAGQLEALAKRKATITMSSPSGVLPTGTTTTVLSVTTKEKATCKYNGTNVKKAVKFKVSGKKDHSTVLGGLENGKSYSYNIACKDNKTGKKNKPFKIKFSVASGSGGGVTPTPTTSCIEEGLQQGSKSCCSGLTAIPGGKVYSPDFPGADSSGCVSMSGIGSVCSRCGNGKCEQWENSCNCPSDCPKPNPPAPTDTTPPVLSSGQPSGNFVYTGNSPNASDYSPGSVAMSVATNENATCRYSTTPGVAFGSMAGTFSTTGGTTHQKTISYYANTPYSYYVRCQDSSGNANTSDYLVSFCGYSNAAISIGGSGCPN